MTMTVLAPMRQHAFSILAGSTARRCFSSSRSAQATWGFIGLGRMGYPMAKNLRAKLPSSDKLLIHDVNLEVTSRFAQETEGDIAVAKNVRDVAENSEVIITVLPEPHHVQNVFKNMLRSPSLLEVGVSKPRLFLDCSTIDPRSSIQVAKAVHSSGQGKFVDAPMSGGTPAAEAGKLTFMIGASDELAPRVTEILEMIGKRIIHLGPQGSGLKGKLANNYLLAINNIATAEAMNMGIKWGLDATALAELINASTGKCWPSEVNNPVPGVIATAPASKEYVGGFGTALMAKDLKLAMIAAEEYGIEPRLGPIAKSIYDMVEKTEALKGKDFSIVYKMLAATSVRL